MKREMLKEMGIAEELIDKIMAENGKDIQSANAKAESYKADALKVAQLTKQLDELNNQNLSDIEKANKATETANNKIADLEKQIKLMTTKNALAEKGIVGEQADKLFKEDGSIDLDILGQIISDREAQAATNKEKELAQNATNPGGGKVGGTVEKTEAEKIAESLLNSNKVDNTNNVIQNYL